MANTGSSNVKLVVVGVDGSDSSCFAVKFALKSLQKPDVTFHIVHVRRPDDEYRVDALYAFKKYWVELENKMKEQSQQILKQALQICERNDNVVEILLMGDPRVELCKYCERTGADILVLGEKSQRKIKWMLTMGSVSRHCTHHAPCSVLICRQAGTLGC
eukprot:TRINITY_DN3950_c0_g1_i1.p1 TRINITY_DN3950_c0_g1~~TRINITY_DN3950_c0_g1_i1.p1  ORF type:complete len:176 (+),score=16.47 TRINITY_DN3950_c0_g1_i1:50-529(+)